MNQAIVNIDQKSPMPKYRQIVQSITRALEEESLRKGDKLPSLNSLRKEFNLSQDTILMAYNELKARGVIHSRVGKGYYIANTTIKNKLKIFLLFDNLTAYKETIYESFKNQIGNNGIVEIFFHHFNKGVYQNLIESAIGKYTSYVIMPIPDPKSGRVLEMLNSKRVFILDQGRKAFGHKYSSVCQNFENDIFSGLEAANLSLAKYKKLILISTNPQFHFKELIAGFSRFCLQFGYISEIIPNLDNRHVRKGEVYIAIHDRDLVELVKQVEKQGVILGSDLGIISYNDTPLKEVVADGITVISTDFGYMGKKMAELVHSRKREHFDNPSALILRSSL